MGMPEPRDVERVTEISYPRFPLWYSYSLTIPFGMKLFITSRNGIEIINLDKVVYLKADGNYTDFYLADGKVRTHLSTLSVFDEAISERYASAGEPSPFFRMGRSHVVHVAFVTAVNLANNRLVFDCDAVRPIDVTKSQLKSLRDFINDYYRL